jgi:cell division protein FtsB
VPARLLESLLIAAFGEIAASSEVAKRLIERAPKAKTSKIRSLTKERQAIRRQLKELDTEVKALTEKILRYAGTVVGDEIDKKVTKLTERKNSLTTEEVRLNREIDSLKSDILVPEKLRQALAHFSKAVKCLSEDEQRELYKLLFKSIIVSEGGKAKDPVNENAQRARDTRRQLSMEVRLRTEAIQTLFGGESTSARKKGFTIPLEIAHCRKKSMENCAILSPIHKECGYKTPVPKKRQKKKKKEHEIHRAIRWKKEMEELGIGQNELARRKGYSCPAVAAVMAWLKLCPEAIDFIKNIPEYKSTRSISRSYRKRLIGMNASEQISAIKELLSEN